MKLPDLDAFARHPDPPTLPDRARLRALARRLREQDAAELASTLEAALHLFEAADRSQGRLGAGRLQSMARNLLAQLAAPVAQLMAPPAPLPEPPPAPPSPEEPRGLGWILVELGYASEEEVEAALELQRDKGLRIGECLLMLGSVSPERLLSALRVQEGGEPEDATTPPSNDADHKGPPPAFRVTEAIFLGEVALGMELITGEQLEEAMHLHHHEGLRIGEALRKLGYLTEEGLAQALEMQRCLQSVARLAPAHGRLSLGVPRGPGTGAA